MDMPHLELAVFLLGKIATSAALEAVANYLDHPNFNVQFAARKSISNLPVIPENLMREVVRILKRTPDDPWNVELRGILDRPADEAARRIAEDYRSKVDQV
jgi:hypothetical protein